MSAARIITIHSFRRGAGKSNVAANLAALLAADGRRVGVIDTDLQSPSIHILFGLDEATMSYTLNDYLSGSCEIADTVHDVTPPSGKGAIFLVPASSNPTSIAHVLREGYDMNRLITGFRQLADILRLDTLLIDTQPGLNEDTLLAIAITDVLLIVLRLDKQDYQGTAVTLEVARRLEVPRTTLVVNKVPNMYNHDDIRRQMEETYDCPVAAILPHSEDLLVFASSGLFTLEYPQHEITQALQITAEQVGK